MKASSQKKKYSFYVLTCPICGDILNIPDQMTSYNCPQCDVNLVINRSFSPPIVQDFPKASLSTLQDLISTFEGLDSENAKKTLESMKADLPKRKQEAELEEKKIQEYLMTSKKNEVTYLSSCPTCGIKLKVFEKSNEFNCPRCNSILILDHHFSPPQLVDFPEANLKVTREMIKILKGSNSETDQEKLEFMKSALPKLEKKAELEQKKKQKYLKKNKVS